MRRTRLLTLLPMPSMLLQLELHRYATGTQSRVVTAMTLLKSHLFRCGCWCACWFAGGWATAIAAADKPCVHVQLLMARRYLCKLAAWGTNIGMLCAASLLSVLGRPSSLSPHLAHLPRRYQGHVSAALVLGGVDFRGPHLFTVSSCGQGCAERRPRLPKPEPFHCPAALAGSLLAHASSSRTRSRAPTCHLWSLHGTLPQPLAVQFNSTGAAPRVCAISMRRCTRTAPPTRCPTAPWAPARSTPWPCLRWVCHWHVLCCVVLRLHGSAADLRLACMPRTLMHAVPHSCTEAVRCLQIVHTLCLQIKWTALQAGYKDDLTKEEAMELVARAIRWGCWGDCSKMGAGRDTDGGASHSQARRRWHSWLCCPACACTPGCVALACRLVALAAHKNRLAQSRLIPSCLASNHPPPRSGVFNDLGSGSNVDLCVITKEGVEYKRNYELLQVGRQRRARSCCAAAGLPQVLSRAQGQPHALRATHPHPLSPSLLQGKTYQRQFPQRFAAGSVRECSCCHPLSLLPSPRHPLLRSRVFVLCCWPPLLAALLAAAAGLPACCAALAPALTTWLPCLLLPPAPVAVVRERVYDIRRVVTVAEGEPMEMES